VNPPLVAKVGVAAQTAVALLSARYLLWRRGFPGTLARYGMEAVSDRAPANTSAASDVELPPLGPALRVLRAPVLGSTCLPTSLALGSVLRHRGVPSDLVIGVAGRGDPADFSAHAWVEVGTRRLDVSRIPRSAYSEIGRYRAAPGRG
jgi:transglutaminase-like putative cysteine protease